MLSELVLNVLLLLKLIVYYVVESLIFGLVINGLWIYLFKDFINIELNYLHFVGVLLIIRLINFKFTDLTTNNYELVDEEKVE